MSFIKWFGITFLVLTVLIVGCSAGSRTIDSWDFNEDSHTYGMWESDYKMWFGDPPDKTLVLKVENGNYPGDPSPAQFGMWLGMAVVEPELFNLAAYKQIIETYAHCQDSLFWSCSPER